MEFYSFFIPYLFSTWFFHCFYDLIDSAEKMWNTQKNLKLSTCHKSLNLEKIISKVEKKQKKKELKVVTKESLEDQSKESLYSFRFAKWMK